MEHHISRDIYIKLLVKFWKTLSIYTFIMLVGIFLSYTFLSRRIWYAYDPEYPLLKWLHDNVFLLTVACILIGGVVISFIYFYKLARMIEEITDAVEMVGKADPDGSIKLPEVLSGVETELNKILRDTRESRYRYELEQKHKEDLIMYLAHDLKTPLTSIIGYLTLLKDEKDISDSIRNKYTHIALDKSHHLQNLIEEFFEVTRISNSGVVLDYQRVSFTRMVDQILYEFRPLFQEKKLSYELSAEDEVMVLIDPDKMCRVMENLLKNAYNYSYEGTVIKVKISTVSDGTDLHEQKNNTKRIGGIRTKKENKLYCSISNTGHTIPPEKLTYIFDRFYRVGESESDISGTGLGLAIAKRIVGLHRGEISCESEGDIITFRFCLPVGAD